MNVRMHTAVLATALVAAITVGIASAAIQGNPASQAAAKSDRLPMLANATQYVTIETRGERVSMLERVALD